VSYIQFTQKCENCLRTWNAAFGIVGTTVITAAPKVCPYCESLRIVHIGYGWQSTEKA
jgi:rubrerythrin